MNNRLLLHFAIAISVSLMILIGCSSERPAQPMCRVDSPDTEKISHTSAKSGCLIRVNDSLIVIKRKMSSKFDIPWAESNNLENSQCAAHRATWELTGFNVKVGKLLSEQDDDLAIYDCELSNGFNGEITQFPVPAWARSSIKGISLQDPFNLRPQAWNENSNLIDMRRYFNLAVQPDELPTQVNQEPTAAEEGEPERD